MPNIYLTILKWLGLVAIALALLAAPLVYHQRSVNQAFERGKLVGISEEKSKRAEELILDGENTAQLIHDESQKAVVLAKSLAAQRNYSQNLQQQLKDLNDKTPPSVDCVATPAVTNVLRDAANGATQADRDSVSRALTDQVPGQPVVPEQRNIKNVRAGGYVFGGG